MNTTIEEHRYYEIAKTQAYIYRYMARNGYSLEIFSEKYMHSDFCNREMDASYSFFQINDEVVCLDYILSEIGRIPKSVQQYSEDLACWVGSIYRLLHIKTGLPSSVIADRIPFKDMAVAYLGMHTIDDELALDNLIKGRLQIKA